MTLPAGDRRKLFLGTVTILLLTFIAYAPVFSAGFVWDDDAMLTDNMAIKSGRGLFYIWCTTLLPDYFPLTSTSLWLEWRLWGAHALGYHLTNVFLHALSSILIWRILRRLQVPAAWFAALLFAVHPVNVESVAWITERKNTLAMLFYSLSLWLYLRARVNANSVRWWPYILSILTFLFALLSKTSVVMMPFVLLLIEWYRSEKTKPGLRLWIANLLRTAPFFLLSLVLGLVTIWFQYHRAIGTDVIQTTSFWTRLAGAGWAICFYLLKGLIPLKLSFVYPAWHIEVSNALHWLPLFAIVTAFVVTWTRRATWGGPFFFALTYYILMLLPILGFLNIYFLRYAPVADHWQYFALPAMVALVCAGAAKLARVGMQVEGAQAVASWPRSFVSGIVEAGGIVVLAALTMATFCQGAIYENAETLWRDTLRKNRDAWLAHNNLGQVFAARGDFDSAVREYSAALSIKPEQVEARNNLGSVLIDLKKFDEAQAQLKHALKIDPNFAMVHFNLGNLLDQQGKQDEAIAAYARALELRKDYPDAHNNIACLLAARGRYDQAIDHLRKAVEFRPDYAEAFSNLGSVMVEKGDLQSAIQYLTTALRLNPRYADAHHNLANALLRSGRQPEAITHYEAALRYKPGLPEAHYQLANICLQEGKKEEARREYLAALTNRADYAEAHYQLGVLLTADKKVDEAVVHFKSALSSRPDWLEALNNLAWIYATHKEPTLRNGEQAVQLAQRAVTLSHTNNAGALDTLAAAYAEAGQFGHAAVTASRGIEVAIASRQSALAAQIQSRLELYRRDQAYHE
jgi:tetratricopeptide (TPR) repeat protein